MRKPTICFIHLKIDQKQDSSVGTKKQSQEKPEIPAFPEEFQKSVSTWLHRAKTRKQTT